MSFQLDAAKVPKLSFGLRMRSQSKDGGRAPEVQPTARLTVHPVAGLSGTAQVLLMRLPSKVVVVTTTPPVINSQLLPNRRLRHRKRFKRQNIFFRARISLSEEPDTLDVGSIRSWSYQGPVALSQICGLP